MHKIVSSANYAPSMRWHWHWASPLPSCMPAPGAPSPLPPATLTSPSVHDLLPLRERCGHHGLSIELWKLRGARSVGRSEPPEEAPLGVGAGGHGGRAVGRQAGGVCCQRGVPQAPRPLHAFGGGPHLSGGGWGHAHCCRQCPLSSEQRIDITKSPLAAEKKQLGGAARPHTHLVGDVGAHVRQLGLPGLLTAGQQGRAQHAGEGELAWRRLVQCNATPAPPHRLMRALPQGGSPRQLPPSACPKRPPGRSSAP